MRKEIVVKMIEQLKNTRNEKFSFYDFNDCLKNAVGISEKEKSEIFEAFTNFVLRYFETNAMYGLNCDGTHFVTDKKVFVKSSFKTDCDLFASFAGKAANKDISELIKEARKNGFDKKTDLIMYVCNYNVDTFFLKDNIKKALRKDTGTWKNNPYILIADVNTLVDMIGWGSIRFWNSLSEYFKNM